MTPRARHARINAVAYAIGLGLFVLLLRFGYLQLVESSRFRAAAEEHAIRLYPLAPPRGVIVDRRGEVLATSKPSFRASLVPRQLPEDEASREAAVAAYVATLDLDADWLSGRLAEAWETPMTPIRLAGGVDGAGVAKLEERRQQLPGLLIEEEPLRVYPFGDLAAHLLGYIGEISLGELNDFGGTYASGDLVGKTGLEASAERWLKGENGGLEVEVDALGRQVSIRGRREPREGHKVVLTIDRRLQSRAEELLGDRGGAVIAMEAKTGEILAMAVNPRFDPNWFASGRITSKRWLELVSNPATPLQNRAIQALYSPGSIFKIVMATAGLETGAITEDRTQECGGTFWIKTWPYRCWIDPGSHGWLTVEQALVHSCDIFFYKAGLSLTVDAIAKYAEGFGFGDPTGIDLPGEKGGHVPTRAWKERLFHLPWFPGNTVQLSIGQGYLIATPLQLVQLMDMTALEGHCFRPHLLKRVEDTRGRAVFTNLPQVSRRIAIAPSTWQLVKRGLWGCVNYRAGTGYRCHLDGLSVAGKTSTIQNPHGEDHAAFAAFAPADDPQIVVATFVEHGLAGGMIGALITKSLLETWDELPERRALMYRLRRFLRTLNWTLIGCVLVLLAAGWALVLSATLPPLQDTLWPLPPLAAAQTRWIAVGVLFLLVTALVDYHILLRLAPWIYGTGIVLLALVLGIGYTSYGARRWFATRWFFIQPGELAKLGTLLFLARIAAQQAARVSPLRRRLWPDWLWSGLAAVAVPMALIAAQPNLGTAMLLAAGAAAIWIVAGLPWALVGATVALTGAAAPVVWTFLKDYQRARILNFLNPYRDPLGGGYTVIQSVIAIGSGGLTGRGYTHGLQNRLDFIPKHHTDFIVSVLGEEMGWLGCAILLLIYLLLYLEGLRIAHRARDFSGMLMAVGIVSILATQTIVNLGMNVGTIPVTGLPLPLLSYGGSSMIVNCGLLGLLLNISRQRRRS